MALPIEHDFSYLLVELVEVPGADEQKGEDELPRGAALRKLKFFDWVWIALLMTHLYDAPDLTREDNKPGI